MVLSKAFEVFCKGSPVSVMVRGSLEFALSEDFVNELFEATAQKQYTRDLLFSDVLDLMGGVVFQVFPSVNAGYQKQQERFGVSRRSVYGKINHMETGVTRELVRQTACRLAPVVDSLKKRRKFSSMLPGYRVRILDGNHLGATHHRIEELRDIAAGPLPGHSLVVLDPDQRLIVDVFPCEDAHAQERSLLVDVLETVEMKDVWIGDRNFCTSLFLFQLAASRAYFIIRQHATNVRWKKAGRLQKIGRCETGMIYEQRVNLIDDWGNQRKARRITIKLNQPTEDGDTEIHILTNLPKSVRAYQVTEAYRGRWKLEAAFGELASALNCEIKSLGYPPAALFAFGVGLVAYNILSVLKTALAAAHGEECLDEISGYYLADEIRGMMRGMKIAIPTDDWQKQFGKLTPRQMANLLLKLAKQVNLAHFQKHRREPKKPSPKRTRYKNKTHVSTARILAESRKQSA
jgi:hypothetical protein